MPISSRNFTGIIPSARAFQVYVLAVRENFLKSFIHRGGELMLVLLVALTVLLLMVIFGFVCIVVRTARREMRLLALLLEQTKAAEQAESKRKNKSIAFANASHDIRASLACITALIEMCYFEGALSPELKKNLQQMDSCAKDLLGMNAPCVYNKPRKEVIQKDLSLCFQFFNEIISAVPTSRARV